MKPHSFLKLFKRKRKKQSLKSKQSLANESEGILLFSNKKQEFKRRKEIDRIDKKREKEGGGNTFQLKYLVTEHFLS
ncbi:hypothetical protein A7Q09_07040 [Methylacidiphilum sp. Yel]|nr:hypothetical protein A7Q09_07040 [Methylacidiphilum sp. Yel]